MSILEKAIERLRRGFSLAPRHMQALKEEAERRGMELKTFMQMQRQP